MKTGMAARLLLALLAFGMVAIVGIAGAAPAQARIFVGIGVAPWWYGYPYPYSYYYYAPPPVVYAPPVYTAPSYVPPAPAETAAPPPTWYYCTDPAGYYPYVQHCNVAWRPVAATPRR